MQVVAAQLDALQRNDWPEPDAGVAVAFAFSKPYDAESLLPGQVLHASWQPASVLYCRHCSAMARPGKAKRKVVTGVNHYSLCKPS